MIFDLAVNTLTIMRGAVAAGRLDCFARYVDELAVDSGGEQAIRGGKAKIAFLEYDWALNDAKN